MAERTIAVDPALIELGDASASSTQPDGDADAPLDLRAALRNATAELHRRLDRAPDQLALLAPDLTLERYAAIMTRHHHALAIGEAALASLQAACPSDLPPYRPRLAALEDDLATLAAPARPTTHRAAPDVACEEPATAVDARGRYLGTRYVLEGSTLGAAAIARRLERHLPALGETSFAYWRLQAEEAPAWRALASTLASLPGRGQLATAATAAANDAFGVFLRAFGQGGAEASCLEPDGALGARR